MIAAKSPASSVDATRLRDRLRLYLQVMLIVDLLAHVSDIVSPWFVPGLEGAVYPNGTKFVRYGSTLGLAAAWGLLRFTHPPRVVLFGLDAAATLGLTLVYVHIAGATMLREEAAFAPVFAMYGITLLLSVRAALVPSSAVRTLLIGASVMVAFLIFGPTMFRELDPQIQEGVQFIAVAFVAATTVTSHVIYGLQREVRRALQLGQYTLVEKLGEGGMGAVYRARHAMLRREAAIKLIRPELAGGEGERSVATQRFEREAHATASLRSPHTIEVYDFGLSDDGAFYYVMELLDGVDLDTAVRTYGPMEATRVAYLLMQACDSLEEAHQSGLVHRDVKPANLFLGRYGLRYDFVKVLDFGLVALGERDGADPLLTAEGVAAGTPAFLAPEAARGASAIDHRADLYALGCVGYWMLTGQLPFVRDTALATVLAHVNDPVDPPSEVTENEIPAALERVVIECLAKDPADRPASARELAERLGAAVAGEAPWDEARAQRWWDLHRPQPRSAPPRPETETLTVTRYQD